MTEPANAAGEAARLDELAKVTREYAKFSRRAFGFAFVAVGTWVAAGALLWDRSHEWGNIVLALAPLVFVELLPTARAYYQRRGEVIERERRGDLRAVFLMFGFAYGFLAPAALVTQQLRWAREGGPLAWLGMAAAVVALVMRWPVGRRHTRGGADAATLCGLLVPITGAFTVGHRDPAYWRALLFIEAGLLLVAGTYQHLAYRRLERRLAALKGGAR